MSPVLNPLTIRSPLADVQGNPYLSIVWSTGPIEITSYKPLTIPPLWAVSGGGVAGLFVPASAAPAPTPHRGCFFLNPRNPVLLLFDAPLSAITNPTPQPMQP